MTFPSSDKIWLLVIDKVAFGAVVAVIGYLAARYLETYKARQAIQNAIAPKRVEKIGSLHSRLGEVIHRYKGLCARMHSRLRAFAANRDETGTLDAFGTGHLEWDRVGPDYEKAWREYLALESNELQWIRTEAEAIRECARQDAFWLGDSSVRELRSRALGMYIACLDPVLRQTAAAPKYRVEEDPEHAYERAVFLAVGGGKTLADRLAALGRKTRYRVIRVFSRRRAAVDIDEIVRRLAR